MSVLRVPPIITLTTDFGLAEHYVGTMKGVILGRCPEARLVDISHEIPPFSIYSAAYAIDPNERRHHQSFRQKPGWSQTGVSNQLVSRSA